MPAFSSIRLGDPLFKAGAKVDYLILSSSDPAILAQAQRIADWKLHKGLKTRVVTVDSVLASSQGVDDPQKIRNFIKYAYREWKITWLLIAGDLSMIPARKVSSSGSDFDEGYTDVYYACLDGEWDSGDDGIYGNDNSTTESSLQCTYDSNGVYTCQPSDTDSVIENDLWSDIYIGRLPASTGEEARIMVDKILTYRATPRPRGAGESIGFSGARIMDNGYFDFQTNATMDDGTFCWHYQILPQFRGENSPFRNAPVDEMYEDRILSDESVLDDSLRILVPQMRDFLSTGRNLTFFTFHGFPNGIWLCRSMDDGKLPEGNTFTSADALTVNSPTSSNFVTLSCSTMKMIAGTQTCFAKTLMINPNGAAVSYTGASAVDYFTMRKDQYRMAVRLLTSDGVSRIAQACQLANVMSFTRHNILTQQHWGDPELELWSRAVPKSDSFTVSVTANPGNYHVKVAPALDSVLVCAYKKGEFLSRGYTVRGEVLLDSVNGLADGVVVTATLADHLPGTAIVDSRPTSSRADLATTVSVNKTRIRTSARGVSVVLPGNASLVNAAVLNAAGAVVSRTSVIAPSVWQIPGLANGIYLLKVTADGRSVSERFTVRD